MDMTKVKAIADGVASLSKRFDSFLERRKDARGDASPDTVLKAGTPVWENRQGAKKETVLEQKGTSVTTEQDNRYHITKLTTKEPSRISMKDSSRSDAGHNPNLEYFQGYWIMRKGTEGKPDAPQDSKQWEIKRDNDQRKGSKTFGSPEAAITFIREELQIKGTKL